MWWQNRIKVVFFLVVFFLLSFFYIKDLSRFHFSPDEVAGLQIANKGAAYVLLRHKTIVDTPLERIFIIPFIKIKENEFFARLPYAILALATLGLLGFYVWKKWGYKYSILALLFCGSFFYFFRYSQELRYYSIYAFFFLLSNLTFFELVKKGLGTKRILFWMVVNIVSFYFNIFTIFSLIFQFFWLIGDNFVKRKISWRIFMGFLLIGLAILPWVLYNDPIKIVVSSVIGFKKPERSIFGGGTDWLEPRQRIDLWSLVVTIFTNICVSVVTKFIVLVLLGIYVLWIIVSKRYRIERIYFGLALLANYIMVILGTIYLIPGVLSDYGSVERRLMFLIPLLTYILILLISDIKTNLLLKYLLLGFMGVSICVQFWLCRFWLKEQLPSSVFVINVDVKKEYSADVDAILKTLKNKKDKRIYIIDAYSTGDLVLNYYLKNNGYKDINWIHYQDFKENKDDYVIITVRDMFFDKLAISRKPVELENFNSYVVREY